jgi:hypothetical protein
MAKGEHIIWTAQIVLSELVPLLVKTKDYQQEIELMKKENKNKNKHKKKGK